MSLFTGTPQQATSYVTSTSETPKWMQDAIYNQIQMAQNVANTPYQAYTLPTVAQLSPLQQQAYTQAQGMQGSWKPTLTAAQAGMQAAGSKDTASGLQAAQNEYLRKGLVDKNLNAGQEYWGRAGQLDAVNAAQPYMSQSAGTTAQALSERAMQAANPYLQAAAQSSATGIDQYMNPYNEAVTSRIAELGGRNLSENLLPNVSDAFVRAGQFGGSRMGEFGARALRDTQESVLGQQAQALQQGYGQALGASQADLARQAQLAGTVGSISGADLSRVLQGAGQYGQLASTAGQLTSQQMQNLGSLGQMQTTAGQAQQQFGLTAAQAVQQAQAQDAARQLAAAQAQAGTAQQGQQMGLADIGALESAGVAQQKQAQDQMNAAYNQYMSQQLYPKQQLDWLSTQVRGMAPITPTSTSSTTTQQANTGLSPLSQLASGYSFYRGMNPG